MTARLSAILSPADFELLPSQDLTRTVCVVFDVLRATSSMLEALANGADGILPVADIPDALKIKQQDSAVLLAGERDGLRIEQAGKQRVTFDFGNSPREFTREKVRGRTIAITTTNGTRALRACGKAKRVFVSALLNLSATARALEQINVSELLLICSGTFDEIAYEDVIAAGGLCEKLRHIFAPGRVSDAAELCRQLFLLEQGNLKAALGKSRNGRRLLSRTELADDVAFCARVDALDVLGEMDAAGVLRLVKPANLRG